MDQKPTQKDEGTHECDDLLEVDNDICYHCEERSTFCSQCETCNHCGD